MSLVLDKGNVNNWISNSQVLIAADTDTTVTVPALASGAFVAADQPYWVDDVAVTLPSASSFATTTTLKNALQFSVVAGSTLHFRSRSQQDIYIAFFN